MTKTQKSNLLCWAFRFFDAANTAVAVGLACSGKTDVIVLMAILWMVGRWHDERHTERLYRQIRASDLLVELAHANTLYFKRVVERMPQLMGRTEEEFVEALKPEIDACERARQACESFEAAGGIG